MAPPLESDRVDSPPSNDHTRTRIEEALVALTIEGAKVNHDNVAERAGVSRRTVYRYFPDQSALRHAMWARLGPAGGMPTDLGKMLRELPAIFANFEARVTEMTVFMASLEGRAIRNDMKPERLEAYRSIYAEATHALPEPDRTMAIAAMQLLSTGLAWREMHDQWELTGEQMGVALRWAIEALLADLKRRGDLPLRAGAAPQFRAWSS